MIYFVIGAALGFVTPAFGELVGKAWAECTRDVGSGTKRGLFRRIGDFFSRPDRLTTRRLLAVLTLGGLLGLSDIVLHELTGRSVTITAFRFFERASGFRSLIGYVFGLLLVRQVVRRPRPGEPADAADAETTPSSRREGGPWFSNPAAVAPVIMLVLLIYAVVAPRGEVDLGFLERVKTPFGEAEFARNEAEFRLELVSEPQGFFQLGRRGLGDPLEMARASLFHLRATATPAADNARAIEDAELALDLMTNLLQPVALCVEQIHAIYGDQELQRKHLAAYGESLARALILAQTSPAEISDAQVKQALLGGLIGLNAQLFWPHTVVLRATAGDGKPYRADLCNFGRFKPTPDAYVRELDAAILRNALKHPTTHHAIAMFFLWSGNPRAVDTLINRADAAVKAYPGIQHIRGFVRRWLAVREADPGQYMDFWQQAERQLSEWTGELGMARHGMREVCLQRAQRPVIFASGRKVRESGAVEDDHPRKACGDARADEQCEARIALGYFTYFQQVLRNHIVYETAREVLAGTHPEQAQALLDDARPYAQALHDLVEHDGFGDGLCYVQQSMLFPGDPPAPGAEARTLPITIADKSSMYGLYLDSVGLLTLAEGVLRDDDDRTEDALALFQESSDRGAAGLGPTILGTIRGHRDLARRQLGLESF
jgi:hypothetical protein